jgi:hypothetical protein
MIARPAIYHRSFDTDRKAKLTEQPIIKRVIEDWRIKQQAGPVIDCGWTMSSCVPTFFDIFGSSMRAIVLHRHPIEYAASATVAGRYSQFSHDFYSLSPFHEGVVYREYARRWGEFSCFDKNLFQWLETVKYGLEIRSRLSDLEVRVVSLDEMIKQSDMLSSLAAFTGFGRDCPVLPSRDTNRRLDRNLEIRPLGDKWKSFVEHPDVIQLAKELGYDMSEERAREIASRYQCPKAVVPMLRSKTRYWQFRGRVVRALRRLRIRAPQRDTDTIRKQSAGLIE